MVPEPPRPGGLGIELGWQPAPRLLSSHRKAVVPLRQSWVGLTADGRWPDQIGTKSTKAKLMGSINGLTQPCSHIHIDGKSSGVRSVRISVYPRKQDGRDATTCSPIPARSVQPRSNVTRFCAPVDSGTLSWTASDVKATAPKKGAVLHLFRLAKLRVVEALSMESWTCISPPRGRPNRSCTTSLIPRAN
jgi:hypothetical protein